VQHCYSVVSDIYSMVMVIFGKLPCVLVTSLVVQRVDVLETKMKTKVIAWCYYMFYVIKFL